MDRKELIQWIGKLAILKFFHDSQFFSRFSGVFHDFQICSRFSDFFAILRFLHDSPIFFTILRFFRNSQVSSRFSNFFTILKCFHDSQFFLRFSLTSFGFFAVCSIVFAIVFAIVCFENLYDRLYDRLCDCLCGCLYDFLYEYLCASVASSSFAIVLFVFASVNSLVCCWLFVCAFGAIVSRPWFPFGLSPSTTSRWPGIGRVGPAGPGLCV